MERRGFVEAIIQEIRRVAQEEAQKILKGAEEEARKTLEEAKEKASRLIEERRQKLLEEVRKKVLSELAPRKLELRRKALLGRYTLVASEIDKLVSEVISEAKGDLQKYREYLMEALKAAVSSVTASSLVVHPCKGERELVEKVVSEFKESVGGSPELAVGEEISCSGGVIVRSADGRVYFNATLDAKAAEIKERLLPLVFEKVVRRAR
uniref:V-ATPase subunit E n=1 Tax=Thermofilum pendens TaxID=2269 RepID=A0A7J3X8Q2_THEPE